MDYIVSSRSTWFFHENKSAFKKNYALQYRNSKRVPWVKSSRPSTYFFNELSGLKWTLLVEYFMATKWLTQTNTARKSL